MSDHNANKILKAAIHNDLEFIKNLKQFCPDFHWQNIRQLKSEETALHYACDGGYYDLVRYLLTYFEPRTVNVQTSNLKTPLHCAAQFCHYNVVQLLIDFGADVNALKNGDWTPVMLACMKTGENAFRTIDILVRNKANLTHKNYEGWTAFMLACREGDLQIVKYLADANPYPIATANRKKRYPIHIACLHGHLKIVEEILNRHDSDRYENILEVKDSSGHLPFHDAVLSGDTQLVQYLISCKGADPTATNNEGWNALHLAAGAGLNEMVEYLITDLKFDPNSLTTDKKEITPLHCAAHSGCQSTMELLERLNADPTLCDWKSRTPKELYQNSIHLKK
ncbi:ankyrin repeat domain-containing protein 16-like [Chrysoperla carnea]|uniref:ankyrin repeat domain-containing protein 16-like n=1 Tax=Chrysoperla carnea TaxID=189513 RepID=UPI001D089525|nr:ankyrin repeat domain-containing protein 16-like [Chrysoperla carnea]